MVDKTGWRRYIVLPVMSLIGLAIGIVYVSQGGLFWIGVINNFIDGTWGITFLGLLECIVLGWLWRIDLLRRHANERSDWRLGVWWDYLIRIFVPIILGTLFVWSLFDDLTQEGGFLHKPDGELNLANCVGLSVMILVPITAVLVSLIKGRGGQLWQEEYQSRSYIKGRAGGAVALVLALFSAALIGILFVSALHGHSNTILLWISLPPSVIAIIVSNYVLGSDDRSSVQSSWIIRWSGVFATMDVSGFVALYLIYSNPQRELEKQILTSQRELSGVSYLILGVVLLLIIGGLGWCFYRALTACREESEIQYPDQQ